MASNMMNTCLIVNNIVVYMKYCQFMQTSKCYILIQMQEKYTKSVQGYRLTDLLLGTGSFSQVFLAYSRQHKKLAAKVIPRCQIQSQQTHHFFKEIQLLSSCKHDNIVELIDFKRTSHNYYLFLEFCDAGNLADYIRLRRKLPQSEAIKLFGQILKGMSAMHQFKIVHRDLKPANILLKDGKVKIADFGLACKFAKNQLLKSFAGTPLNMAPQILKGRHYNQKVDIYSAGTVLYQMLFGTTPFKGRDTRSLIEAIQKGKDFSNCTLISERIQKILTQMLMPEPQDRIDLSQLLDFIHGYEQQKLQQRLVQYRRMAQAGQNNYGATGAMASSFDFATSSASPKDVDMHIYSKLINKLSQRCVPV